MRKLLLVALLATLALATWNFVRVDTAPEAPAPAADEPAPVRGPEALSLARYPGRIADDAGILGHYLPTLTWQTQAWRDDLGIDFHVATLAEAALPINQLAADVFTRRQVGEGAPTGGILLLLDPTRRQARIEVSYELEGAFPDLLIARVAREQLVPYVAYSAIGMASMDVLHFLKNLAIQQSLRGALVLDERYRQRAAYVERARFLSGGAGARVRLPTLEELASHDFKSRVPEARRARYAPSADPIASVEALLRSKREFAGDPSLPLFTPGSRCMKRHYPFAPYEEAERAQTLETGRPWRVATRGDRAVVTAGTHVHGFVPVLLQRIDGTWRVDLVETWKNLFFDQEGNYNLRNANTPYAFGLAARGGEPVAGITPWDLGGVSLERVMETLEARDGPLYDFLLGEVLFRNCFLPDKAFLHYEAALRAAPRSPLFAETLGDRASYVGFTDVAIGAYQKLGPWGLPKLAAAFAATGDYERALGIARRMTNRNPYDAQALGTLREYLRLAGRMDEAAEIEQQLAALEGDPRRLRVPLAVTFDPIDPVYDIRTPTLVGEVEVFDHAYFALTVSNPTGRAVEIEKMLMSTAGFEPSVSGLGDIRSYFAWPSPHRLEPGRSVEVTRTWGFTIDTPHDQLSYVLDICWRGDGEEQQCDIHRLDLMPR